jgi:hypothetical protein
MLQGPLDTPPNERTPLFPTTMDGQLIMATHDVALATAAQAHGFRVVGVESGH